MGISNRIAAKASEYLTVPSVVGFEDPFLSHLEEDFGALGVTTRRRGEVLSVIGGPGRIVTCHVDRHGLLGVGDGHFRYAAHALREEGETPPHPRVSFLQNVCRRLADEPVVAYDPVRGISLGESTVRHRCEMTADLVFELPEFGDLPPGTPVAYTLGCVAREGTVVGQLDNVVSVAALRILFEGGFDGTAVFTTGEEVGRSWQGFLEHVQGTIPATEELVVLDTSPFPNPEQAREGTVVLRTADAAGGFNVGFVQQVRRRLLQDDIPVVLKDDWIEERNRERLQRGLKPFGLGRTELGRLVAETDGRWSGATVQLATYNYHTNEETTSDLALDHFYRAIRLVTGA